MIEAPTLPTDRIARVQSLMRETLGERRLVVVSNREPYVHHRTDDGVKVELPPGGLVSALDPVLQATGGTWVAWGSGEADFDVVDDRDCVRVPPAGPSYTLRRVRLSRDDVDRFYHGYANQALWPLFHLAVDKARFVRRHWEAYRDVNRRFAAATLQVVGDDDLIWIQDYHLAMCPYDLRQARRDLFIMHFWHIPWPSWDVFRISPQSADLLEGLLANDLLAFHVPRHVENFLDCARHELGAEVDHQEGVVEYRGHLTHVRAFPISIDVDAWERVASSKSCERWMTRLRQRFGLQDRSVVIGVDRLDYTKGIPERLRTVDHVLRRSPELRGRFVYVQKSAPSRTRIKAYRALQRQVEGEITRINAAYGSDGWRPIVYLPRPIPPAGMAALYRMADVCLVTSLQDGMNLVAKEFIASQVDGRGVLVLSELAGAAEETTWALPMNPFDPESSADALRQALAMPAQERAERMDQMRARLQQHDIYYWVEQHIRAAAHLIAGRATTRTALGAQTEIRRLIETHKHLALLVDFDGTLAPLADYPDDAQVPPKTRALLARLSRRPRTMVAIVSGRAMDDLRRRVGLPQLVYVGNHGFELAGPGWVSERRDATEVRALIGACSARLRDRLRGIRGALVENKGLTATVHYRMVRRELIETVRQGVLDEVAHLPPGKVEIHRGKMVLEIRPAIDWDKGRATLWLLDQVVGGVWREECAVIYVGDDRTDEDAFMALGDAAVTIKVGPSPYPTAARYAAGTIDDLSRVLELLWIWTEPQGTPQ
jgi:trehalose 6-phosphate synthase